MSWLLTVRSYVLYVLYVLYAVNIYVKLPVAIQNYIFKQSFVVSLLSMLYVICQWFRYGRFCAAQCKRSFFLRRKFQKPSKFNETRKKIIIVGLSSFVQSTFHSTHETRSLHHLYICMTYDDSMGWTLNTEHTHIFHIPHSTSNRLNDKHSNNTYIFHHI